MNRFSLRFLAVVYCFLACATLASSQEGVKQPLRLVQTISIPNVKGRLDHMEVDVQGKRLFVAGLENGTFEVADLRAGKWTRSIPGFKKPQGALYIPELNKYSWQAATTGWSECFEVTLSNFSIRSSLSLVPTASSMNRIPKWCM